MKFEYDTLTREEFKKEMSQRKSPPYVLRGQYKRKILAKLRLFDDALYIHFADYFEKEQTIVPWIKIIKVIFDESVDSENIFEELKNKKVSTGKKVSIGEFISLIGISEDEFGEIFEVTQSKIKMYYRRLENEMDEVHQNN